MKNRFSERKILVLELSSFVSVVPGKTFRSILDSRCERLSPRYTLLLFLNRAYLFERLVCSSKETIPSIHVEQETEIKSTTPKTGRILIRKEICLSIREAIEKKSGKSVLVRRQRLLLNGNDESELLPTA